MQMLFYTAERGQEFEKSRDEVISRQVTIKLNTWEVLEWRGSQSSSSIHPLRGGMMYEHEDVLEALWTPFMPVFPLICPQSSCENMSFHKQGRNADQNEAIMAKSVLWESETLNECRGMCLHTQHKWPPRIPPHPHTPEPLRDPEVGGPGTAISEPLAQKIHLQSLKKLTANSPNH